MVYKQKYRNKDKKKKRPEPKTRRCIECRIRHATEDMEKIGNVWYCESCSESAGGSSYQKGIAGTNVGKSGEDYQ